MKVLVYALRFKMFKAARIVENAVAACVPNCTQNWLQIIEKIHMMHTSIQKPTGRPADGSFWWSSAFLVLPCSTLAPVQLPSKPIYD